MEKNEFIQMREQLFNDCSLLTDTKGNDYTKGNKDVLFNFKETGNNININAIDVCYIFMHKHYQAITNYIKTKGQSESEPIEERVKDLINYLVLLQALIKENESK